MRTKIAVVLCALVVVGSVAFYRWRVDALSVTYGGVEMPDLRFTDKDRAWVREQAAIEASTKAEIARLLSAEIDRKLVASITEFLAALTNPPSSATPAP